MAKFEIKIKNSVPSPTHTDTLKKKHHILQAKQNMVILRCCFAENAKEMRKELLRMYTAISDCARLKRFTFATCLITWGAFLWGDLDQDQ